MSPDPDTTLPRPAAGARRGPDTAHAAPSVPRARSAWRGAVFRRKPPPRSAPSHFTSTEREVSALGVVSLRVPNVPRGRRRGEAAQPPTVRPVIQSLSQLQVISLLLVSERLHSPLSRSSVFRSSNSCKLLHTGRLGAPGLRRLCINERKISHCLYLRPNMK